MKIQVEVNIPTTPNYIRVGGKLKPITDFTDSELREIGKEWTQALVEKSRRRSGALKWYRVI